MSRALMGRKKKKTGNISKEMEVLKKNQKNMLEKKIV